MHGSDNEKSMTSGVRLRIPFTANVSGRSELELHHSDPLLAVLEVRP